MYLLHALFDRIKRSVCVCVCEFVCVCVCEREREREKRLHSRVVLHAPTHWAL